MKGETDDCSIINYVNIEANRGQERQEPVPQAGVGVYGRASPPVCYSGHPKFGGEQLNRHRLTFEIESHRDGRLDAINEAPAFRLDDSSRGAFLLWPPSQSRKARV